MKKLIIKIWKKICGMHELNDVLGSLSKPLKQLEELQAQHAEIIKEQEDKIAELAADNTVKTAEKNRAARVHANISTLLAVDPTPAQ